MAFHGPLDPVYTISVAARLLGVNASFLRQIENEGLVAPARTGSNIRLYSDEDLRLLSRIVFLCRTRGVNLQGVRVILAMEGGDNQYPLKPRPSAAIALGPGEVHKNLGEEQDNGRDDGQDGESQGTRDRQRDDFDSRRKGDKFARDCV